MPINVMLAAATIRAAARKHSLIQQLNRTARICFAIQLLILVAAAPGYAAYDLEIDWTTVMPQVLVQAILVGLWLYYGKYPGGQNERALPDVVMVTSLLIMMTNIASPAQYVAVAMKRPLIDPWLARSDAFLGVDVPSLVGWTKTHPVVSIVLTSCYFSLLPQFVLTILVIGLWYRDRIQLWEYAFHFHFCLFVTLCSLALFPAECAFQHYGFDSTINQTRFIAHFEGLRSGTLHRLKYSELEGLISMPSFHVAGAFMVTWAVRSYRHWWPVLGIVNVGLIAATVMSGAHYFVDLLASAVLFLASILIYRHWVGALLFPLEHERPASACQPVGDDRPVQGVLRRQHEVGSRTPVAQSPNATAPTIHSIIRLCARGSWRV